MTRKEETINYIKSVLSEKIDNYTFSCIPVYTLIEYLKSIGWNENEEEDNYITNGWQVDYWYYMIDKFNQKWIIMGSVFDCDAETITLDRCE